MDSDYSPHDDHGLPTDPVPASNDDVRLNTDSPHDDHCLPTDPVPASNDDLRLRLFTDSPHDDHGLPTDSVPAPNDDLRLNTDHPISLDEAVRCINCGSDITQRRRHVLNLMEVRRVILQWIAPQVIEANSQYVCHSCWTVALNISQIREHEPQIVNPSAEEAASSNSGRHRQLCVSCRTSLMRIRSHSLNVNNERERLIRNVIAQWINPHELRATDRICHPCWQRANREVARNVERDNGDEGQMQIPEGTIFLPDLRRASDTQSQCFLPGCNSVERLAVPKWLRVHIFTEYNYYVPQQCRICTFHLQNDSFDLLGNDMQSIQYFTADHIQDFASFVKERKLYLDFNKLEQMSDHLIYYWTGLTKPQFAQLKAALPNINRVPNSTLALAAFLIKLRTGDSNERISTLLNVPRTTLVRYINKVRDIMVQDFVPNNLGIAHITREQIAARNLVIPNGLFGGEKKPITIIDGTYLYIQKSSNYMYQKDTYSLHKYRNLMKPFLMVCSDGYIIDILGPYPATTSDANIMLNEFNNDSNTLRRYFQPGDVFILDRGFRDSVPLLEECQYSVHFPLSMQQGETQLSTAAANKSRTVTICRWVVEAVNGIFKMSFKLFRSEYFNTASTHAITDFRIAAALINQFHERVTDRPDAGEILQRIILKRNTDNILANWVIENNFNRRRAQFVNINVNMENLIFPRLTYNELVLLACGTYQIKQARSYYGEHIRNDGSYTIEVCTDRDSNLLTGFPSADNCTLLRGKIQSRHISRKIYFIYILYQNNTHSLEAIKQYYCNCIVGRRTVGCCAHIMSVIWYLSWARYENVSPPAQFLDNILITYEGDGDI